MKRKTLDMIVAAGGLGIALLLAVLGFVLAGEASFARGYVKEQLGEQRITFAAAEALSEEEKSWKPGSVCLVENAGQPMISGPQAECYANYFIAMHMRRSAKAANYGWDTETYATMGDVQKTTRAEIAAAKESGDTAKAGDLQKKLDAATALRSTFQTGETLRGLLLTSFGFSVFGEKAALAASLAYAVAALMGTLSAAGFLHALLTPAAAVVGAHPYATREVQAEAA